MMGENDDELMRPQKSHPLSQRVHHLYSSCMVNVRQSISDTAILGETGFNAEGITYTVNEHAPVSN